MKEKLEKKCKTMRGESGFSLIEAIVTMVIFMIVMAAVFGILRAGNLMLETTVDHTEIVSNARSALNIIGREAVNAGLGYSRTGGIVPDDFVGDLLKTPIDADSVRDIFPGVFAGNDVSQSSLSVNGEKNDIVSFISRDLDFNDGESIIISDNTGAKLITSIDGCTNCQNFDLYLVESAKGNQALAMATVALNGSFEVGTGDPLGLNRDETSLPESRSILVKCLAETEKDCFNYTPQATAKRVFLTSYSVTEDGTLIRTVYGNNSDGSSKEQIQVQPLAFNVQSFQIRYLMKDGTLTDDPSAGNTDQMKLNEIVQVEVRLTIQSTSLDNGVATTQLIELDSTFSTRNLRYDFE